jgi:hypothetical protein
MSPKKKEIVFFNRYYLSTEMKKTGASLLSFSHEFIRLKENISV